jgi:hypothetical protein
MKVEKVGQQNLPVRMAQSEPSDKGSLGRDRRSSYGPRGQTSVRLPSQCSDAPADGAPRTPVGVGETGLGAVEGRWRPPPTAGWHGGMGMSGLGTDGVGETAEVGSALLVLRVRFAG